MACDSLVTTSLLTTCTPPTKNFDKVIEVVKFYQPLETMKLVEALFLKPKTKPCSATVKFQQRNVNQISCLGTNT